MTFVCADPGDWVVVAMVTVVALVGVVLVDHVALYVAYWMR